MESQLALNLRILAELGRQVERSDARMIVVHVSRYFSPSDRSTPEALEEFCARRTLGYVELSELLLAANDAGISTRWPHDLHFNEAGNRLIATTVAEALSHDPEIREKLTR